MTAPNGHMPRRERLGRWQLLKDDERFGLRQGDVLVGRPYWLDPGLKITIEYRESDGRDPMCNQYRTDLKWLGWAEVSR